MESCITTTCTNHGFFFFLHYVYVIFGERKKNIHVNGQKYKHMFGAAN